MSVKASGGKIWNQDKVRVKQSDGGENVLVELLAIIAFAIILIFVFIIPIAQSLNGNTEKSSDKDSSLSTSTTYFKDTA